jgi:putative flippase GtrA
VAGFDRVSEAERLTDRVLRFARALVVGSGATLVDFSLFTTCIRIVGMTPTAARLPALCAGASVQFFGNRSYTFRARAGSITRQARIFVAVELGTLLMNYCLFSWLVPKVHGVPPELVSFFGTFVVFITFAYPMRRLVIFKLPN